VAGKSASRRIAAHFDSSANAPVVATNQHGRVEAAGSVRRARLEVPVVTGGAYERGTSKISQRYVETL
jgi:hypothetical protein